MHGDNDTNVRCPECGALDWVLEYSKVTGEHFGSCEMCTHVWPVDLEELDKQIGQMTCPKCEARNCEVDHGLNLGSCQHCGHDWLLKEEQEDAS